MARTLQHRGIKSTVMKSGGPDLAARTTAPRKIGWFMSRESLVIRTLVELADSLVEDLDVVEVLTVLGDRCVEALDVSSAGVMLATPSGELQVLASSSDAMRDLELFELQANEGPCVDCYRSGQPIVNLQLSTTDSRWPRFARRAIEGGFRSVHALPMHLKNDTLGALNMFRVSMGPLNGDDVLVAQALADVATIVIIQHQITMDARKLNGQLNEALNSRIVIEQAKGKISESSGIDMEAAFRQLRTHARNNNLRLTEVARAVAEGIIPTESIGQLAPSRNHLAK